MAYVTPSFQPQMIPAAMMKTLAGMAKMQPMPYEAIRTIGPNHSERRYSTVSARCWREKSVRNGEK